MPLTQIFSSPSARALGFGIGEAGAICPINNPSGAITWGFETGLDPDYPTPNATSFGLGYLTSTDYAYAGTHSLHTSDYSNGFVNPSTIFTLHSPPTSMTVSAWVKWIDGDVSDVFFRIGGLDSPTVSVVGEPSWVQVSHTFGPEVTEWFSQGENGCWSAGLLLLAFNMTANVVNIYVDNISVEFTF